MNRTLERDVQPKVVSDVYVVPKPSDKFSCRQYFKMCGPEGTNIAKRGAHFSTLFWNAKCHRGSVSGCRYVELDRAGRALSLALDASENGDLPILPLWVPGVALQHQKAGGEGLLAVDGRSTLVLCESDFSQAGVGVMILKFDPDGTAWHLDAVDLENVRIFPRATRILIPHIA